MFLNTWIHNSSIEGFARALNLQRVTGFLLALWVLYFTVSTLKVYLVSNVKQFPGPFWTIFSNIDLTTFSLQQLRAYRLLDLHKKYGPVVRVGPNEASIGDWRYYRPIYSGSKVSVKDPRFYAAAQFVGHDNIFQMTNPIQHTARRKLSAQPYSLQSISKLNPLIERLANEMTTALITGSAASQTGTVDAYHLCGLYSFQVICKAAFNKDFSEENADNTAWELLKAMEGSAILLILDNIAPYLHHSGWGSKIPGFLGHGYRSYDTWVAKSREMYDHFLETSSGDDKFFMTPLVHGTDDFLERKLSYEEVIEEGMGVMFAGSGTTSSTLTYLLYTLSLPENHHIQTRLREEVLKTPDNILAIRNHPYVNAVLNETLRLYPTIISTLPRVLLEPMKVGDYLLPAGTVVGMQNYVHHRNPIVFPDPGRYYPDRWLNATEEMTASLTPFSLGRRGCIGQNLAWEELYVAVNTLMRAGIEMGLGQEMKLGDMDMMDRFNIAPRGRKLMLEITRI